MMKVAIVYDRVNKFGGAERVLLSLHKIWPDAPLFTAVYNRRKATWAEVFKVRSSFLQKLPFASSRHEMYPFLTSLAFESFNLDKFQVVISVTSAEAKAIITKPDTLHLCYCLTPTRYLWSGYFDYLSEPGAGLLNPMIRKIMKLLSPGLRYADSLTSARPDKYIAISETVSDRIQKYYRRSAEVIFPPVNTDTFKQDSKEKSGDYFLIVARLVPYKSIDYVISAFNSLGWKLKIIGRGLDEKRLKKLAAENIEFLINDLTDEKLCWYYQNCKGLIFPGEEDFGIAAVEAQSCGRPVLAYRSGGVTETVIKGKTGDFYDLREKDSLIKALKIFINTHYSPSNCRKNALRYSEELFQQKMTKLVDKEFRLWKEKV